MEGAVVGYCDLEGEVEALMSVASGAYHHVVEEVGVAVDAT